MINIHIQFQVYTDINLKEQEQIQNYILELDIGSFTTDEFIICKNNKFTFEDIIQHQN